MKGIDVMLKDAEARLKFISHRREALSEFLKALDVEVDALSTLVRLYKGKADIYEAFQEDVQTILGKDDNEVKERPVPKRKEKTKRSDLRDAILIVLQQYGCLNSKNLADKVRVLLPGVDNTDVHKKAHYMKKMGEIAQTATWDYFIPNDVNGIDVSV